jgi:hypothetical protein
MTLPCTSPSVDANIARTSSLIVPDLSPLSPPSHTAVDYIQPHAFVTKARGNPDDNPTLEEALGGEHQAEYYQAALNELKVLQETLDCWELVPYVDGMHVLPSTCAFKCKRYPDGCIKKFKARFCARGDRQIERKWIILKCGPQWYNGKRLDL